ncbi:MAG: hypothetical protein ACYTAF_15305 [Planctomycetota bacterium]
MKRRRIRWGRAVVAGLVANVLSFVIGGGGYIVVGWLGGFAFTLEPEGLWKWQPDRTS